MPVGICNLRSQVKRNLSLEKSAERGFDALSSICLLISGPGHFEPQISVLMPTFNQASFLRRAILSLRAQTFTNWELLIVDDGSSDETPALIAELRGDLRIRDWRLDENSGFPRALNLALEAASAPYV